MHSILSCCVGISEGVDDVMCYCYFTNSGDQLTAGRYTATFVARLNGEIRGRGTRSFAVTDGKFALFCW